MYRKLEGGKNGGGGGDYLTDTLGVSRLGMKFFRAWPFLQFVVAFLKRIFVSSHSFLFW